MSNLDFSNFGKTEETKKNEPILNGEYVCKTGNAKQTEYKGRKQIAVSFEIIEGEYKGRRIFFHILQSKNDPEQYDNIGIGKIIFYGQDKGNKNARFSFRNYDDLIQYLNTGLVMKLKTRLEYNENGEPWPNPKIDSFSPVSEPEATSQGGGLANDDGETSDEVDLNESEGLPF